MRKSLSIQLLLTLLVLSTGCSRFRGLTRQDYALTQDPFAADVTADASADDRPPIAGMQPSNVGVVQIDALEDGLEAGATADYRSVDAAAISPNAVTQSPAIPAGNPFAQVAHERVMAAEAASDRAEVVDPSVIDDFAAFAARRSSEWLQDVENVNQATLAAGDFAANVEQFAEETVDAISEDTPEMAFARGTDDVATPLISKQPATETNPFEEAGWGRTQRTVPAPDFDTEDSPMTVDPADWSAAPRRAPAENSGKLDSGFHFDTGWRPSGVMRP